MVIAWLLMSLVAAPRVLPQLSQTQLQEMQNVNLGVAGGMAGLKSQTLPVYPADAIAAGVRGDVELEVVVGKAGDVLHVRVAKPLDERLDRAAVEAIRRCTFVPPMSFDGRPMTVLVGFRVEFALKDAAGATSLTMFALSRTPSANRAAATPPPANGTSGKSNPVPIRQIVPRYTSEAMRAKVMGTASLDVLVLPDGTVGEARIAKSLDNKMGLDQEALVAARYWLFEPARVNGQPVPIVVRLDLEFKVH